jgi:DNA primase
MNLKKIKKTLNDDIKTVFKKLDIEYEVFNDNIYSTCPVHEGSDNPRALSYSMSKGIWRCWTRNCEQHHNNDVFGLIQGVLSNKEGKDLEFKDALRWVYQEFGLGTSIQEIEEQVDDFSQMVNMLSCKKKIYQDKSIDIPCKISKASDYFYHRGFKKTTLKHFDVGDCHEKGIMNERAVVPIHNDDGSLVVGMIGRSIKEYRIPKFLIYPTGFDKRWYLYNYHRAAEKAKETKCLFILEGQGDVWRMKEAGVDNAVSVFGKSITTEQEQKISKLCATHLIILTDNDQAGREAKLQIHRQLGRMYRLTFPKIANKDVGDMKVTQIKTEILNSLKGTY